MRIWNLSLLVFTRIEADEPFAVEGDVRGDKAEADGWWSTYAPYGWIDGWSGYSPCGCSRCACIKTACDCEVPEGVQVEGIESPEVKDAEVEETQKDEMKLGDPLEITWIDSYAPRESGWTTGEDYLRQNVGVLFKVITIGYLIHKDKDYYTLVGCYTNSGKDFKDMVNRGIRIPVKSVMDIKCLTHCGIKKLKAVRTRK